MPIKGADVLLYVNTGSAESPVWTKVAGQRMLLWIGQVRLST